MVDTSVNVWPADVPTSLWSYHRLEPERDLLPFMGLRLEWNFVLAFIFGAALVAVFAWQRFRQPTSRPDEVDYEVLKRLAPTQLRGIDAMRQAYFYYAGILIAIYTALTFFGGLIFKLASTIPMAGLEVNIGRDTLTSPTWPLTLAIGMAGFAPLLKPVEIVETWLRRKVHGWAGVPMQLKERTRRLLLTLDKYVRPIVEEEIQKQKDPSESKRYQARASSSNSDKKTERHAAGVASPKEKSDPDPTLRPSIVDKLGEVKPWMKVLLERSGNYNSLIRKWAELEIMVEAMRNPGSWPDTLILDELQPLSHEQRLVAERALLALQDFLDSDIPKDGKKDLWDAASRAQTGDQKTENENTEDRKEADEQKAGKEKETIKDAEARRRRQLEMMLNDIVAKIDKSRLELAAILAVYAERSWYQRETGETADSEISALEAAVKEIVPPEQTAETGFWVLILLPPIFCIYALTTRLGLHSPLASVELTAMAVFATAALETLQVAIIFWLPVIVVTALRQYLADTDRRRHLRHLQTRRRSAERMIYYVALATVVAAIGLALLAAFWTALIAENPTRFRALLFVRPQSAFATFIPKSVCAGIFAFLLVRASERWALDKSRAIMLGAAAALLMAAIIFGFSLAWQSGCLSDAVCTPYETLRKKYLDPDRSIFYRFYNLTDPLVCFAVVFVALTHAAWPRPKQSQQSGAKDKKSEAKDKRSGVGRRATRTATFLLLSTSLAVSFALSGAAFADPSGDEIQRVLAGFRRDAEPFSYSAGPSSTRHYRGYAADLCYSIFDDSPYILLEVEVTAANRFDNFLVSRRKGTQQIDILCDPTTLRYSRNDQEIDGYFSPIVFVTGVSYMVRPLRDAHTGTDLAYVENTTAEQVAMRACDVDYFGTPPSNLGMKDCKTPLRDCPDRKPASKDTPSVRLCSFETHDQLTQWFCEKGALRKQVYFGDREIIKAKFESWKTAADCSGDDVEPPGDFYTYEPYALLVSRDRPELARFVQRRVYDFFSHREKAIGLFRTYFPGVQMSPMMADLILLNGIDDPIYATVPSYLFDRNSDKLAHEVPLCMGYDCQ
ncbi:hypothetical protein [Rhizobium sp. 768_B6_N1_8]|uniref:hypothetical protein n=1 Tax=unclassified Rhizobium TaxID=2613769 RepID=UPI003F27F718